MSFFYAVHKGRRPGIFDTWNECQKQTSGYPNAVFKKFKTKHEAEDFLRNGPGKSVKKNDQKTSAISKSLKENCTPPNNNPTFITPKTDNYIQSLPQKNNNNRNNSKYTAKNKVSSKPKTWKPVQKMYDGGCQIVKLLMDPDDPERYCVYTDGSCVDNGKRGAKAGIGIYWGDGLDSTWNISRKLSHKKQTNNIAEFTAVIEAVKIAIGHQIGKLLVLTDSQYVIKCMTVFIKIWQRNGFILSDGTKVKHQELVEQLSDLIKSSKIDVKYSYVPGHRGYKGNERADRLANKGMQEHDIDNNKMES